MSRKMPDYSEDKRILASLSDPIDVEAFFNLMDHAHQQGISAADFVREEPKRTSRKAIRKLCLKDRKRSLRALMASIFKSLWERPAENPEAALIHSLYAPTPPKSDSQNGRT